MLSDPVAEAFGLIHRHPSGENFCRETDSINDNSDEASELSPVILVKFICNLLQTHSEEEEH